MNGFTRGARLFGRTAPHLGLPVVGQRGRPTGTPPAAPHVAPPSVVYSHFPLAVSAPVMATPRPSVGSASVTWATRVAIGAPAGVVPFGIGILIGGSIGVERRVDHRPVRRGPDRHVERLDRRVRPVGHSHGDGDRPEGVGHGRVGQGRRVPAGVTSPSGPGRWSGRSTWP